MLDELLLRRLFADAVARSGAFGAQLSVVKAGEQLDLAAGLANAERGLEMTANTLIQIGSITKVFNAVILMGLIEEGLLNLDAPVCEYLPELQISADVTLRHLLSMSSGLDNGPYVYFSAQEDALAEYVSRLGFLPQHFAPGVYFGYSNAGICIAGHIASRVTRRPWEVLLKERILRPAGLPLAAILDEDVNDARLSVGHSKLVGEGATTIVQPKFSAVRGRAPSGPSFALTARGLTRFASMFLNGGLVDTGSRILSERSIAEMLTPQVPTISRKYGSAWCVGPCMGTWNGTQVFGHGGSTSTSSSYLYWLPQHRAVIAFIVNTPTAMGELSRIVFDDVLQAAFGLSRPRIDDPDPTRPPLDVKRYVGTYEELGMRMEVVPTNDGALSARWIPRGIASEQDANRSQQRAVLVPLDRDRFLVRLAAGPDKHRGVTDAVFFGDDGRGRATNALNLVFPMSRVTVE